MRTIAVDAVYRADRRDKDYARRHFEYWEREVARSGVEVMKKVARMIRKHFENIPTCFDCFITNSFSERINSKANARGFSKLKNFKNYRTRILFFCCKLSLVS
jgi:transposase